MIHTSCALSTEKKHLQTSLLGPQGVLQLACKVLSSLCWLYHIYIVESLGLIFKPLTDLIMWWKFVRWQCLFLQAVWRKGISKEPSGTLQGQWRAAVPQHHSLLFLGFPRQKGTLVTSCRDWCLRLMGVLFATEGLSVCLLACCSHSKASFVEARLLR